jgi:hypothetical protein
MGAADEDGRVCYICMEEAGEAFGDMCACRDRVVHPACLVRWVEQSGKTRCTACDAPLRGVSVARHVPARARALHCAWPFLFVSLMAIPAWLTSVLVRNALARADTVLLATGVTVALYLCAMSVAILLSWAKSPPAAVRSVHIELPELGV